MRAVTGGATLRSLDNATLSPCSGRFGNRVHIIQQRTELLNVQLLVMIKPGIAGKASPQTMFSVYN